MLDHAEVSERRACRLAGLSRDAFRHPPVPSAATCDLSARLVALAQARRRFGYRRLHDACLNEQWFTSWAQAPDVIADWRRDYNEVRPHKRFVALVDKQPD